MPRKLVEAAAQTGVPELIELRHHGRQLRLRWPDQTDTALSAAMLRGACRCAACTHAQRSGAQVQPDPQIAIEQVAGFGVAGLQLVFSDGHRRGIFPWEYLRQLAAGAN